MKHTSKQPSDDRWWERYAVSATAIPTDATVTFGFLVVADVLLLSMPEAAVTIRSLAGLPLLFFLPGYALLATLFPRSPTPDRRADGGTARRWSPLEGHGLPWRERLALSFGASLALLPPLALLLSVLGLGYGTLAVVGGLSAVVAAGTLGGVVRRSRVPEHERFEVPARDWADAVRDGLAGGSTLDRVLAVAVALVAVVAVAGVGYGIVRPNGAEAYTSVSLLTETASGDLVAAGYPSRVDADGEELVLAVENSEGRTVTYTVVAELQRVRTSEAGVTVVERRELDRLRSTVAAGDTWTERHRVEPAMAGSNLRLVYYVYRGEAPATPDAGTAYRYVELGVDVPLGAT